MPVRLIYIDDQGREWLVRDAVVKNRKFVPIAIGNSYPLFRVFDLREPRIRKVYRSRKVCSMRCTGRRWSSSFPSRRESSVGERTP